MGKRKDEVRQMPIMVEYRVGGGVAWGEKKKTNVPEEREWRSSRLLVR